MEQTAQVRIPARTTAEFRKLMEANPQEVRLVRSMSDWSDYIRNTDSKDYALQQLKAEEIKEFTDSLVFRNGGLAGAKIRILQEKLTYLQYVDVLGRFGIDIIKAAEHAGYKCVNGTCVKDSDYLCTSNCGTVTSICLTT